MSQGPSLLFAAMIEEAGNVRLVIIETLDDLLKLDDIKENSSARLSFDSFNTHLMHKFADTTAFLALHHLKKAETSFARDAVLGASTIIGRTDAKIYLEQASPDDERRVIHSSRRVGTAIPRTYLFNPITGRSELGETVSAAAITAKTAEYRAARQKLFDVLAQDPSIEHGALLDRLGGKRQHTLNLIREHVLAGLVLKIGKGTKGSPFTYQRAEAPVEGAMLLSESSGPSAERLQ
jgi:hypothetical protein